VSRDVRAVIFSRGNFEKDRGGNLLRRVPGARPAAPQFRFRDVAPYPEREQGGESSDQEQNPPSEARQNKPPRAWLPRCIRWPTLTASGRWLCRDAPRARFRRPVRTRRTTRLPSQSSNEYAPDRELHDGTGRGGERCAERIRKNRQHQGSDTADPVRKNPKNDPSRRGSDQRHRHQSARLGRGQGEFRADGIEGEGVEHDITSHPASTLAGLRGAPSTAALLMAWCHRPPESPIDCHQRLRLDEPLQLREKVFGFRQ